MAELSDHQKLAARVLDCLGLVTPSVLAGTSAHGARIGIPKDNLRALAAELERQFPGALAEVQEQVQAHRKARKKSPTTEGAP